MRHFRIAGDMQAGLPRPTLSRLVLIAAALACVLVSPSPAPAQEEKAFVPFSASYVGTFDIAQMDATTVVANAAGFGYATYLPGSTAFFSHFMDTSTDANLISAGSLQLFSRGEFVYGEYQGAASPLDADGNILISGSYTLTNGTGRFSDVQGSGGFNGVLNIANRTLRVSFEGQITPPQVGVS